MDILKDSFSEIYHYHLIDTYDDILLYIHQNLKYELLKKLHPAVIFNYEEVFVKRFFFRS